MTEAVLGTSARQVESAPVGVRRLRLSYDLLRALSRLGAIEPEIRGLAALVPPGSAVLDVGAALGLYTLPLAHLVGSDGRVDSFEPQHRGHRVSGALRRLTGAHRGRLCRVAVGAEAGVGSIAVPVRGIFPIFGHGHVTPGTAAPGGGVRHTETELITIDAWVTGEGIERVAFIKMDVEGFEPAVIMGARQTITRDLPAMLLEIEDRHLARYGLDAAGFVASVLERWPAYRLHRWDGRQWVTAEQVGTDCRNYLFATADALPG